MKWKQIRAILDPAIIPIYTAFSFIGFAELNPKNFSDYINMAVEETVERLVSQYLHEEKFQKGPEKKRPWKYPKTRFPFEGKLRVLKFKKKPLRRLFRLCWSIVKKLPCPVSLKQDNINTKQSRGPGRPPEYNWLRITAAILATFYLFGAVWQTKIFIEVLNLNVSIQYRRKSGFKHPSVDEIYKVFQKIPSDYIVKVLNELDGLARKRGFHNLGLFWDSCAVDGSAEEEHHKEEYMSGGAQRLRVSTVEYTAFVRLGANTVLLVAPGTPRDITEYYPILKESGVHYIYADPLFRVYVNHEEAERYGLHFITRKKPGSQIWIHHWDYGKRKLVEILFGDEWMRTKRRLFGRISGRSTYKKLLLRLVGHNLHAYERISLLDELFKRRTILEEAYLEL